MLLHESSDAHLADVFYHYYDALAPNGNCTERLRVDPAERIPATERSRVAAAIRLTFLNTAMPAESITDHDLYFTKPGEAEWGC